MEGAGSIRHVRSAGRMTQRTYSSTTVSSIDDNISVSSSYTASFKRSYGSSKTSSTDYSGGRAAAGSSRMKNGRGLRRGSVLPSDANGLSEPSSAKGHRLSIYSLSGLAEVGIRVRRRRRSTMDSWGKNRTPGETQYFDKVSRAGRMGTRTAKASNFITGELCINGGKKDNIDVTLNVVLHLNQRLAGFYEGIIISISKRNIRRRSRTLINIGFYTEIGLTKGEKY